MNKSELIAGLQNEYKALLDFLNSAENFDQGPEGKWTTGQHADHLVKSTSPMNKAMRMPKFQLKLLFGKNNRAERSFDETVAKYQEKLKAGGKASGRFLPKEIDNAQKQKLIARLEKERDGLIKVLDKWTEEQLSEYLLPHPLIGKMTIRELLCFTIYHTSHHRKTLEEKH